MLIFLLWKNEHLQHQITLIQLLQQQKVLQTIYLATQKKAKLLRNIKTRNKNYQHIELTIYKLIQNKEVENRVSTSHLYFLRRALA